MTNLGTTTSVFRDDGTQDADYDGPEVEGVRVALEGVASILVTPQGAVFYDSACGVTMPLQGLVNATIDDAALRRLADEYAQASVEQVEGVEQAVLRFVRDEENGLVLVGAIFTADGPGQLQVSAAQALTVLFPGSRT